MKKFNVERITLALIVLILGLKVSAENKFYIDDFIIAAGETKEIAINLNNDVAFGAFQSDLYLPAGLTASDFKLVDDRKTSSHMLSTSVQSDGAYRLLCFSFPPADLLGNSGVLITFSLTAAQDFLGEYKIELKNNIFTTCDEVEYKLDDTSATVIDLMTGVEETLADVDANAEYYTLQGLKVTKENLTQGVYIKKCAGKTVKVLIK